MARIAPLRLPFLLVLVAALLAAHTPTLTRAQTTTTVCPSGCEYSKIEDAVIATSAGGAAAAGTTITVAPGTYQEDQGLIIASSMTIRGIGQPSPIVSAKAGSQLRAVSVLGPNTVSGGGPVIVTLENLTIQGSNLVSVSEGATVDPSEVGGGGLATGAGIANGGTLTLTNVTVSGGITDVPGGGIFNNGTLTLNNSTVSGNNSVAGLGGGGIFNTGTLALNNSKVSDNTTAGARGGGILNTTFNLFGGAGNALLTLTNSTVSNNSAAVGGNSCQGPQIAIGGENNQLPGDNATPGANNCTAGGGIASDGTLTITGSTITGNTATNGGGIQSGYILNSGTVTLTNTTVSNNSAGQGGGINTIGHVVLIGSTITANNATYGGGGIFFDEGGTVTLTNSSVTGNTPNNCVPVTNSVGIPQCLGSAGPVTPTTPVASGAGPAGPAQATSPQASTLPAGALTGSWTIDDFGYGAGGTLRLVQNGNQVTGTYAYADPSGCGLESGRLTGTVNGSTLTSSTVETGCGGEANGDVTVTLAPDGRSFTGDWNGTRTGS